MDIAVAQLLSLEGKVVLVTGGAAGIGEGIARLLAAAGATVVIGDVDEVGAERVAEGITGTGGTARAVRLDVTDHESAVEVVERITEDVAALDVLVNNAGYFLGAGSILEISPSDWHRTLAVNLEGVFNCSKAACAAMVRAGRGGVIVNIASVDGLLPCIGVSYDSAKAGVIQFTRSLAVDMGPHGIRVNAVAPGMVPVATLEKSRRGELPPVMNPSNAATGLGGPVLASRVKALPLGRAGTPEDMARAVLFFASDLSSYVTGTTLAVDGGWLLL